MKSSIYKKYHTFWPIVNRHLFSSLPYLNLKKIINIIFSKFEELIGREKIKSQPFFIKIEPTNKCNLNCPGCLHAKGREELINNSYLGDMDFSIFRKIIDELKNTLIKVSLYFEGESLLHPQISEMVKYLTNRKIGSVISSNLNFLPDDLAESLVKNKLTQLVVCLDGYDEESYQKYRKGGKFENVINNIKKIQQEKKKQKSKYPLIEMQTINFSYFSDNDIQKIKKIAKDLGINYFTLKDDLGEKYKNPKPKNKKCFWLYGNPTFHWSGKVQACCYYYDKSDNTFGDISQTKFSDIWNNEKYIAARRYFRNGKKDENLNLRCYKCIFFKYDK